MTLNEYQDEASKTAIFPRTSQMDFGLVYCALKLAGEAGEFAEKIGKCIRDKNGILNYEDKDLLIRELGDVLWYVSQAAAELGMSFEEIAQLNIAKLRSRADRNKLSGSGDLR